MNTKLNSTIRLLAAGVLVMALSAPGITWAQSTDDSASLAILDTTATDAQIAPEAAAVSDASSLLTIATDTCGAPANPWGYTYCGGSLIYSPAPAICGVFACIASFWNQTNGYVAQCVDGLLSHSGGVRGACSGHGGVRRPLYASS